MAPTRTRTTSSRKGATGAGVLRAVRTSTGLRKSSGHISQGPNEARWKKLLPRLPKRYRGGTKADVKRKVDRHLLQIAEFIYLNLEEFGL